MREYISNEVNTLRLQKGITQEELAEAIGVTRQREKYFTHVLVGGWLAIVIRS